MTFEARSCTYVTPSSLMSGVEANAPNGPEPLSACVQVRFSSSTFSESISEFATRVFS